MDLIGCILCTIEFIAYRNRVSYPVGHAQLAMEAWHDQLAKTYDLGERRNMQNGLRMQLPCHA
eukprot:scaffold89094_cov41-Prasinocladus_malaysianus.AAC.1